MIKLSSFEKLNIKCCKCNSEEISFDDVFFQGLHVLAECKCNHCGLDFYHTLPFAHNRSFPIQFCKNGKYVNYDHSLGAWLAKPLVVSMVQNQRVKGEFYVVVNKTCTDVVIINCLDTCFGHMLYKLCSAWEYSHQSRDIGIIVLIPKQFEWLVPENMAEKWMVSLQLSDYKKLVEGLDSFIKIQLKRFNQVYLGSEYKHPSDIENFQFDTFLQIKRFDLTQFHKKQKCITYVLREDRFWHNSRILDFIFKLSVKFKLLKLTRRIFIFRQNHLINRTSKRIKSNYTDVEFYAVGTGNTGKLDLSVKDLRFKSMDEEKEKLWLHVYSQSHMVVGIHGSNMILPTSLAGGFINIVPRYKINHLVEDTVLPYSKRVQHYLGRFLDEYSSPKYVADHIVAILRSFKIS